MSCVLANAAHGPTGQRCTVFLQLAPLAVQQAVRGDLRAYCRLDPAALGLRADGAGYLRWRAHEPLGTPECAARHVHDHARDANGGVLVLFTDRRPEDTHAYAARFAAAWGAL